MQIFAGFIINLLSTFIIKPFVEVPKNPDLVDIAKRVLLFLNFVPAVEIKNVYAFFNFSSESSFSAAISGEIDDVIVELYFSLNSYS